jgi:hypothetical protein
VRHGFQGSGNWYGSFAGVILKKQAPDKLGIIHRSRPVGAPLVTDCTDLRQLLENTFRFCTLLLLLWGI